MCVSALKPNIPDTVLIEKGSIILCNTVPKKKHQPRTINASNRKRFYGSIGMGKFN